MRGRRPAAQALVTAHEVSPRSSSSPRAWSHALAAAPDVDRFAEVDANPNPLREEVYPLTVEDGWVCLPDTPGLGVEPDLVRLAPFVMKGP